MLATTCSECNGPIDTDGPIRDRRTCSDRCRTRRSKRLRVESARRAVVQEARVLLRRQTRAIRDGDLDELDAVEADAAEWLASLDD